MRAAFIFDNDDTNFRFSLSNNYEYLSAYKKGIESEIYLETKQKVSSLKILKKLESLTENNLELLQIKTTLAELNIELERIQRSAFNEGTCIFWQK